MIAMKRLYFILGFILISMFTWGQGLDGITRFDPERIDTDGREKFVEVEFMYRYDLGNYPAYQMERDISEYRRTNFHQLGAEVEVQYTSNTTGKWRIYIPENSTSDTRGFEFHCQYAHLVVVQTSLPTISVFNLSGGGNLYAGSNVTVYLKWLRNRCRIFIGTK